MEVRGDDMQLRAKGWIRTLGFCSEQLYSQVQLRINQRWFRHSGAVFSAYCKN